MMKNWKPAKCDSIDAWFWNGLHVLVAKGTKPTPCHKVEFNRSLLTVEPPAFELRWYQEGICIQVLTPYRIVNMFSIGAARESLLVHTADGPREVKVKAIGDPVGIAALDESRGRGSAVEGVGYSSQYSFDEAFRAAMADASAKLPPPNVADAMAVFEMVLVGAEVGGFAGFNHMVVRVRATSAP